MASDRTCQTDGTLSSYSLGAYPRTRLRRNRHDDWSRRLVAENIVTPADLIWPVFVQPGDGPRQPIASMPGVDRLTVAQLIDAAGEAASLGIPCIALFPATEANLKTDDGQEAWNENNLICQAVRALKRQVPDLGVLCDVALDPYTSHGHDGIVVEDRVVNDETIEALVRQSLTQARAGCDVIAPSDMMDGRIGAIRDALDANGFQDVAIMSYATKFASAFYGPYREAVGTAGLLKGDKKTYYIDHANSDEAVREAEQDIAEGADMLMVKPGLPYLDIIRRLKDEFQMPTFAYQVSGEYSMIKAAGANGWIDGEKAMLESLLAFKRAGCDGILTYFAPEVAAMLKG